MCARGVEWASKVRNRGRLRWVDMSVRQIPAREPRPAEPPGPGTRPTSVKELAPAVGAAEPDDGALARRAAGGDRDAASVLIDRYQHTVRRFLLRLTGRHDLADDLAQDTFVRMLKYASHYDPRHPMRTWLLTIARRLSINRGRRDARRKTCDDFPHLAGREGDPAELAAGRDERRAARSRLDAAIARLTGAQRQAVTLFHAEGLSVQEAAEVMGLPVGTVKSHLHRARAAMRTMLGAADGEGEPNEG